MELGTAVLDEGGVAEPSDEASYLLSEVLEVDRGFLFAYPEKEVSKDKLQRYEEMIAARARREPYQYVVGHSEFYGRDFKVTRDTFIPRPETEFLVEAALDLLSTPTYRVSEPVVADIGTGSGAIAVTLAAEVPYLLILATDSSPEALRVAEKNAAKHGVKDRIVFREGPYFDPLRSGGYLEALRLFVSNPPYVKRRQIDELSPEVRKEPVAALDGGKRGLCAYRRLAEEITRSYPEASDAPRRHLLVEVGRGQAERVRGILENSPLVDEEMTEVFKDLAGIKRVVGVSFTGRCRSA